MILAILILATWRITKLFITESGPFRVFYRIRRFFGASDLTGEVEPEKSKFMSELLSCLYCFSIWVGILISLFSYPFVATLTESIVLQVILIVCLPFTLSGGALLLHEFVKEPEIY